MAFSDMLVILKQVFKLGISMFIFIRPRIHLDMWEITQDSIDTFITLILNNVLIYESMQPKIYGAYLVACAQVKSCTLIGPACFSDFIDTLISPISPHLAEIWACARKTIACMHASLGVLVTSCDQRSPANFLDAIDTLIPLIRPNLPKIWACTCKKIACKHNSLCA